VYTIDNISQTTVFINILLLPIKQLGKVAVLN
jgi:hypothetical protein